MPHKKYKIDRLKKTKFSLILSGGSSLGLAHIGTIKFLEHHHLEPSEVIGTSMGSIVGALYAIGETAETIEEKLKNLETNDLFEIKYLQGRIDYKKAKAFLKNIFQNKKIQDTRIPLKIIATKLKNGEEKIFTKEDNVKIYDAIIASISIPGVLEAEKIKSEIYIDGCVSSNLPIEAAKKDNIKLAINVINKKARNYHYENPKHSFIKNLITKFQILRRSSRYYILNQTESKIKTTKKLILIEPNLKRFNSFKLINHKKIIQAGYLETKKYFDEAEKMYKKKHKKKTMTPLERVMTFPLRSTKKMIENIQKLK